MLAFVGEANDGLEGVFAPAFLGTGIRLGVSGRVAGAEVVGEIFRRFPVEGAILCSMIYRVGFPIMFYASSCGVKLLRRVALEETIRIRKQMLMFGGAYN
jgi:hypothetical protein